MKTKNKFLSLGLITPSLIIPFSLMSASHYYKLENSDENNTNKKNNETPKNASDFDDFKELSKKLIEKSVTTTIDYTIKFLDNEKAKLLKDLDKDFKNNIEKLIYIQVLKKHLEDNKENLKTNHSNANGFTIVFPYLMSLNKKYNIGKIEYNKETFNDVKIGQDSKTNYEEQVKPNGKIAKNSEEINTISKSKLEKLIKDYFGSLTEELPKMLYDEKDVPKINEDIKINIGSWKDDKNTIHGFNYSHPKNFKSWEEYITSKLHKKFLVFDLDFNKNFTLEEEKEKKKDEPINKPELIPGEKPKIEDINTEEQIQAIPSLTPHVSSMYSIESALNLKINFDAGSEEEKNKMFFFDNPINTRYSYTVTALDNKDDETLIATVKITDRVDTKKSRSYKIELKIDTSLERQDWNFVYEKIINANKELFSKIFYALNIDNKIDYSKLRNSILRDALYNMIATASSVLQLEKYNNKSKEIIASTVQSYTKNRYDEINLNKNIKNSEYLLLTSLFSSKINDFDYFYSLTNALKDSLIRFKEIIKINKDFITNNFNENGFDINLINQYYNYINMQISRLIASTGSRTINIFSWYDSYIKSIKQIMDNFSTLSILIDNKKIIEKKDKEQYEAAYFEAESQIDNNNKINKKTLNIVGISLLSLSSIFLLTSLIFIIVKKKQIKNIKISKLFAFSITIIFTILIASIIIILI